MTDARELNQVLPIKKRRIAIQSDYCDHDNNEECNDDCKNMLSRRPEAAAQDSEASLTITTPTASAADAADDSNDFVLKFTDLDVDVTYEISKYLGVRDRIKFERLSKPMATVLHKLWRSQRVLASCLATYSTDSDFCRHSSHRVRTTDILLDSGDGTLGDCVPSLFVVAKKCPNLHAMYWSGTRLPLAAPPAKQALLPSLGALLASWCPYIEHFHFSALSDFEAVAVGYANALTGRSPNLARRAPRSRKVCTKRRLMDLTKLAVTSSSIVGCLYLGHCSTGLRSKTSYRESLIQFVLQSPCLDTYTNVIDDPDLNPLVVLQLMAPRLRELTVAGFGSAVKLRKALQLLSHYKQTAQVQDVVAKSQLPQNKDTAPLEKLSIEGIPLSDNQVQLICCNFPTLKSISFWSDTRNMRHLRHLYKTLEDVSWMPCHVPDTKLELMAKDNPNATVSTPQENWVYLPAAGAPLSSQTPRLTLPLPQLNYTPADNREEHPTVDVCLCQRCRVAMMAAFRRGLASREIGFQPVLHPDYGLDTPLLEILDSSESDDHNNNDNGKQVEADDKSDNDSTADKAEEYDEDIDVLHGAAVLTVSNLALLEAQQFEEYHRDGGYDHDLFVSFLARNGGQLKTLRLLSCDLQSAAFAGLPLQCPRLKRITIDCPDLSIDHEDTYQKIDDDVLGYLEQCKSLELLSIVNAPRVTYTRIGKLLLSCPRLDTIDLDNLEDHIGDVFSMELETAAETVSTLIQQLIDYSQRHSQRQVNVYMQKNFAELSVTTVPEGQLYQNGLGFYRVYSNLLIFFSN